MAKKAISKYEKDLAKLGSLPISGTLIAIDPSSGSVGSMPGFALFKAGRLLEAGTIRVTPGNDIHTRLFELRRSLMEDFETPDILVTENIPPFMGGGFNRAILNLHYSVGVILSVFLAKTIRVTPITWQKNINKETYRKSDTNDAIMMGLKVISDIQKKYNVEHEPEFTKLCNITHGDRYGN